MGVVPLVTHHSSCRALSRIRCWDSLTCSQIGRRTRDTRMRSTCYQRTSTRRSLACTSRSWVHSLPLLPRSKLTILESSQRDLSNQTPTVIEQFLCEPRACHSAVYYFIRDGHYQSYAVASRYLAWIPWLT